MVEPCKPPTGSAGRGKVAAQVRGNGKPPAKPNPAAEVEPRRWTDESQRRRPASTRRIRLRAPRVRVPTRGIPLPLGGFRSPWSDSAPETGAPAPTPHALGA